MAQSVKGPTLAQVMISQFVGSSPASGSVLTVRSLETASDSLSPSLSAPPGLTLCVFLSLSVLKINKHYKNKHGYIYQNMLLPRLCIVYAFV